MFTKAFVYKLLIANTIYIDLYLYLFVTPYFIVVIYSISPQTMQHKKCPYSEFFWSVFSRIWTEYGDLLRISSYSVRMREKTDYKNFEYGQFSHRTKKS